MTETAEATGFLSAHPFLRALIEEACPSIEEAFGTGAKVSLQILRDPDGDGLRLGALIEINEDFEPAMARLRAFDRQWWLQASDRAGGLLMFDVERL